jgi:Peptidase family C25
MIDHKVPLDAPLPFGVYADTGRPLAALSQADLAKFAQDEGIQNPVRDSVEKRLSLAAATYAVTGEIDANDLAQAGWAILMAPGTPDDVKLALRPLMERRRAQTGDRLFKVFEGDDSYRPGETGTQWLIRHGVSLNVVDPFLGVPYYFLIVGGPEQIPFEFQYTLDIYWAVGRLHFDTADEYARYAESVVACETASSPPTTRQVAMFATTHDFDRATQLFTNKVARPLTQGDENTPPLGKRQRFTLRPYIGEAATKSALNLIYQGDIPGGRPGLLFSGSHGMGFRVDDARLRNTQGALVCQDWQGYGNISEHEWFSATDLASEAHVHGLVHVAFACYGAGCPKFDGFNRAAPIQQQIAPEAILSRLPQRLLAHPNGGALAVVGHIERAWGYSFVSDRGGAQTQGFRDLMGRLMRGERVGQALDQFNIRWAALSVDLTEALDSLRHGGTLADADLANRWVARDDARNYIIFGDPAVRLRVEDMPELV